jgi:arylformamidase
MPDPSIDAADLERLYNQSNWAPNMQAVIARYQRLSDAACLSIGEPERMAYGASSREQLDLYRADSQHAPVVIFIHGGGWRDGSARQYGFPAEMLVTAGVHFVVPDFSSVDDTKGDLSVPVDQVRRALAWVRENCRRFGGDGSRLYLVGHSSGAHLAGMALSTRQADHDVPADPIRGAVLVSGIYDLGPLRQTSRVKHVLIDDRVERVLSPLHQIDHLATPLLLAVGSAESPEFQRQARDYAKAVVEAGKHARVIVSETYHHFDILETLGNPYGLLGRSLLDLVSADG